MSFKRAFKWIFRDYEVDGCIKTSSLEKIAKNQHINFCDLKKAVVDKGLELVP